MIATATFVRRADAGRGRRARRSAATDLAEWLVAAGMPFRDAHAIVGALVRPSLAGEGSLAELVERRPSARSGCGRARRARRVGHAAHDTRRRRSRPVAAPARALR